MAEILRTVYDTLSYRSNAKNGVLALVGVSESELREGKVPLQIQLPNIVHQTGITALEQGRTLGQEFKANFDYTSNEWQTRGIHPGTVSKIDLTPTNVVLAAQSDARSPLHITLISYLAPAPAIKLHTHPKVPEPLAEEFFRGNRTYEKFGGNKNELFHKLYRMMAVGSSVFSPGDVELQLFFKREHLAALLYSPEVIALSVRTNLDAPMPFYRGIIAAQVDARVARYATVRDGWPRDLDAERYRNRVVRALGEVLHPEYICYYSTDASNPTLHRVG